MGFYTLIKRWDITRRTKNKPSRSTAGLDAEVFVSRPAVDLHQDARIVHRDVKLENCVLDRPPAQGGNLMLCDFGLSEFLPGEDVPSPQQRYVTPRTDSDGVPCINTEEMIAGGSLAYAAPEQVKSKVPLLNTAIDMWSYGVVVHALTIGELPFAHVYLPRLQMMVTKGVWDIDRLTTRADAEVCEVVVGCLNVDSEKRWTATDVLASSWISSYIEVDTI